MPSREDVLKALSSCQEPELKKDIVSLGMVQNLVIEGGMVRFDYILTTPACPLKGMMEMEARDALKKVPGVSEVEIKMKASVKKDPRLENIALAGIKNIVAVGSGKGGVGKSTVACNLAVALAADGAAVGLMDADIYGPNQPQMLGLEGRELEPGPGGKISPLENYGVKLVSMGFLMDPDAPVIWRGPMLHGAVTQFLKDVEWGNLDYLVVDLPPGTGDVQLSLCQSVPLSGALIVTTPQSIAVSDVRRAAAMFGKLNVPLLGVIENMSGFSCPHCGKASEIFSRGGAQAVADKYGAPLLGSIPVDASICASGEEGKPVCARDKADGKSQVFQDIARRVAARISVLSAAQRPLEIKLVQS
ncbi:MAG: Mrp/NBP35 family ATP-binding protein [Elusimicrobiota bacterium]